MSSVEYRAVFGEVKYVRPVPTVTVNLSLPPLLRWEQVIEECAQKKISVSALVKEVLEFVDTFLPPFLSSSSSSSSTSSWLLSSLGKVLRNVFLLWLGFLCRVFYLYSEDIVALATLLNRSPGELVVANVAYEVLGGCSTFIVNNENCVPMLCRTLDWPMPMLAKYTVQFRWVRNDHVWSAGDGCASEPTDVQTLFYSVGWPGYVGVMTGMKPFQFAVALNARYCASPAPDSYLSLFVRCAFSLEDQEDQEEMVRQLHRITFCVISTLRCTAWSSGSILRSALQDPSITCYSEAVGQLSRHRLMTVCYFSVAGIHQDEGVILTRDEHPITENDNASPSKRFMYSSGGDPFVCQTNHDEPSGDDCSPDDFNSMERFDLMTDTLARGHISTAAAGAKFLMTSMNKNGVRMKMTLHCAVMIPSSSGFCCAKSTRPIGL